MIAEGANRDGRQAHTGRPGHGIYSYSLDGRNWVQQLSQGRTTFLTANQIGFCADAGGNDGIGAAASLVSWEED